MTPPVMPSTEPDRPAVATPRWVEVGLTVLTYLAVFVAGVGLALIGSFHIPSRLGIVGAHLPVAVLIAIIGNLGLGLLAGWGLRGRSGSAVAFVGWICGVGIVMFGGTDDVVIGGAPGDWVPMGFLLAGSAAAVVAVAVSTVFSAPAVPETTAGPSSRSSLRGSGRR